MPDPIMTLLNSGGAVGTIGGMVAALGVLAGALYKLITLQQSRAAEAATPLPSGPSIEVLAERVAGLVRRVDSLEGAHREQNIQLRDLGLRTDARLDSIGQDVAKAGAEIGSIVIRQRGPRG